jgi:secreted trypsin-like serine protease
LLRSFLVLVLFGSLAWPFTAQALSGGTADSTDRFPFVVEILYRGELICSGTVLFPRIVVTAAHCLQQKVSWRGRQYYVDDYVHASELSVRARVEGNATLYPAATSSCRRRGGSLPARRRAASASRTTLRSS